MSRVKQVDIKKRNAKIGKRPRTRAANTRVAEAMQDGLNHESVAPGDRQPDGVRLEHEKSGSGESVQNEAIPVFTEACDAESGSGNPDIHRQVVAPFSLFPRFRYVPKSLYWPYR